MSPLGLLFGRTEIPEITEDPSLPGRISVIVPVKDEAATVGPLIEGLIRQTHRPAEIILTDGGSTDRTRAIIRNYQSQSPIPIVLIETLHAYPGRGRNLAIARAQCEWIASIDAGIVPDANWLRELVNTAKRERDARIIYGRFEPLTETYFTECAAAAYVQPISKRRFIASSLFHKSAWVLAQEFREDLRTAEDLLFFEGLDKAQVEHAFSLGAIVYWSLRPSLGKTFVYFVFSSLHSLRAGLFFNWHFNVSRLYVLLLGLTIVGVFRPAFLILIPSVLLLRTERRMYRWYRAQAPNKLWLRLLDPVRVLSIAVIGITIDLAMFCGMTLWILRDFIGAGVARVSNNKKGESALDLEQ